MTDLRPMWSTTVHPSEYDIDGQMRDFVKAANKAKECYYGIDVGKLWGLYTAYKEQADEIATLRAQLAEAREMISEARIELEHAVYPIPPSESVCAKLTAYLQKVKSA